MALPKHDPSVEYFNPVIEIMKDTGIVDHFFRKANPYSGLNHIRPLVEEKMRVDHLTVPVVFVSAASILALLVFVGEKVCAC